MAISETAGHFLLEIDGFKPTAYIKSIDGGWNNTSPIEEAVGPDNMQIKHAATTDIEPVSVEVSLGASLEVLKWIQGSWRKKSVAKDGMITHSNFNLRSTLEHEFFGAHILETTFPTLDGSAKDAAYLKVKFQPERVVTARKANGAMISAPTSSTHKLLSSARFRLSIDGVDGFQYANKIESFTIKQGVGKSYTGEAREFELYPTNIKFPHLTGTISAANCSAIQDWADKSIRTGQKDTTGQKQSGCLEFLSPKLDKTIFRINLFNIGIHKFLPLAKQANQDQINRFKFELHVGRMDIDGVGLGVS